jgi:hypothetical protein
MPEMGLLSTILGIVGGTVSGFFTSWYFWNRDRQRQAPRLTIEATNPENFSTAIFSLRNTGFTHAEDIIVEDRKNNVIVARIDQLPPDEGRQIEVLEAEEAEIILITYKDVWGKGYAAKWSIAGPRWFEIRDESSAEKKMRYFEPHDVERLQT